MRSIIINWKNLVLIVVFCILIGLFTGLVENPPEASLSGYKYYGWPLVWRVTRTLLPEEYHYFELCVDCFFWFLLTVVVHIIIRKVTRRNG